MEQSRPLPNGQSTASQSLSQGSYVSMALPSTPNFHPNEVGTPNTRRLQLRSAGFRGPAVTARKISPLAAQVLGTPGNHLWPINENSPFDVDKRVSPKKAKSPKPVNVLQEIHNSEKRTSPSSRPISHCSFQDKSPQSPTESPTSWYNDNLDSPSSALTMATVLRSSRSHTQATPPSLSSPLATKVNGRRSKVHGDLSSPAEVKYIEHLEQKLAAAEAKLSNSASPMTNKARASKLRALTNENRTLRLDLRDWEQEFAIRLREVTNTRTETERGLRIKLQALEHELESRDISIENMERELESFRRRIKDLESLEATNVTLERRIEVLTRLLVRSPTKQEATSASQSPAKEHPAYRLARPTSTIPRLPTSPIIHRSSTPAERSNPFFSTVSPLSSPAVSESADCDHSMHSIDALVASPVDFAQKSHNYSFGSESRESYPCQSLPSSSTRPTSVQSRLSTSSTGLPSSLRPSMDGNPRPKQRQMRRFLSGAKTLKPLVLPATAAIASPTSSPLEQSPTSESMRNLTQSSMDPTIAFLSDASPTSPLSAKSMQSTQRLSHVSLVAHAEALQALEGRIRRLERNDPHSESMHHGFGLGIEANSQSDKTPQAPKIARPRPRSLHEELQDLENHREMTFEDGLITVESEDADVESICIPIAVDQTIVFPLASPTASCFPMEEYSTTSVSTPRCERREPDDVVTQLEASSPMISLRSPAHSLFDRLTTMISVTQPDPVNLARRLLWNAWILGSASFGGIGWWLLGLALRSSKSRKQRRTDRLNTGKGGHIGIHEMAQYSAHASRGRTLQHLMNSEARELPGALSTGPPYGSKLEAGLLDDPHIFPCDQCKEPSTRQSLRLWVRFSLTIILAVGVAIKHGPGVVLDQAPTPLSPPPPYQDNGENEEADASCEYTASQQDDPPDPDTGQRPYPKIEFSTNLTPKDFGPQVQQPAA